MVEVCKKCNTGNRDGSKFCKKCGTNLIPSSIIKPKYKSEKIEEKKPEVPKVEEKNEKKWKRTEKKNEKKLSFIQRLPGLGPTNSPIVKLIVSISYLIFFSFVFRFFVVMLMSGLSVVIFFFIIASIFGTITNFNQFRTKLLRIPLIRKIPGFRSGKVWKMIIAIIVYSIFFMLLVSYF
jgi:ribosomal protein L40E